MSDLAVMTPAGVFRSFDLRPVGKIFMAEYAKFIAGKNEKLGSAGQLEAVRKMLAAK